jgi:hypothetical protein
MSRRVQIYVLAGLLAVAAFLFIRGRGGEVAGTPGVKATDAKFTPLDVREPDLRLDLLQKIHNTEYTGAHRDIFSGQPMPPPRPRNVSMPGGPGGPSVPAGPPPVQVPAEFFGYARTSSGASRVAFFLQGDNVLVVAEGDTFLGNFRLVHIGNDSADVEEISSGRHASVPLEQPPDEAMSP